ncbi:GDSL-type esterase/lipase family protein [Acholeplasma hippikon]|nr:GDSL-type esterase/lipase family protein [Acholeplasma hippikon]
MSTLEIVLLIIVLLLIYVALHLYKFGLKKGANDFLMSIIASGFEQRINQFKVQNNYVKPGGVVFLGDSITQNYNVYEYFKDHDCYNRGIGGDTTVGLLTRLECSVYVLKPKVVVLLIGTNDLSLLDTTIQEIAFRIGEIVKEIKQHSKETKIILQSVYPVIEPKKHVEKRPRRNVDIVKLNELLKEIKDVVYVDMFSQLVLDGMLNPLYTYDGLHVNDIGYEKITEVLKAYIKES